MMRITLVLIFLALLIISGCGQKGPLFIPKEQTPAPPPPSVLEDDSEEKSETSDDEQTSSDNNS